MSPRKIIQKMDIKRKDINLKAKKKSEGIISTENITMKEEQS